MMARLPTSPIARRLTRITIVASGTALVLAGVSLSVYDFVTFRQALRDNQEVEARIVASNSMTALTFDDFAAAERTLAALGAEPHVEGAALYRPDGRPFASYLRGGVTTPLALPQLPAGESSWYAFEGLRRLHLVQRVDLDGVPIGLVYIRSDLEELTDRLVGYGLILGIVLLMALTAAQLVSSVSRRAISEPITELAALATKLSADKDYSVRARGGGQGELGMLVGAFNEMLTQIQERDRSLQESHDLLEQRVRERTAALDASNQELEAFCYSVSHDLRSPLRAIDGFSLALLEDTEGQLGSDATSHLNRIRAATQRMGALIDDLLSLSRITRTDVTRKTVDLSAMARGILADLAAAQPGREVEVLVQPGLEAVGDPRLLRHVFDNLLGNAWKFTSKRPRARVEFGALEDETALAGGGGARVYFVKDNGAGFDTRYKDRLFGVFQRLHAMTDFPGTGVGLAIVERIVRRHGGRVWADAIVDEGATFYFTLEPLDEPTD
jgi:signal transduction histidine kinase